MTAGGASSLRSWRGGGGRGLIGAVEEVTSRTGGASRCLQAVGVACESRGPARG